MMHNKRVRSIFVFFQILEVHALLHYTPLVTSRLLFFFQFGETPLHSTSDDDIARYLVSNGADLHSLTPVSLYNDNLFLYLQVTDSLVLITRLACST